MVKISNICFAKDKYFDLESDLFFLNENKQTRIRNAMPFSVARSGVLTPKWCFGTPLWCGNFGSGVFIKKGDFSILTSYFH